MDLSSLKRKRGGGQTDSSHLESESCPAKPQTGVFVCRPRRFCGPWVVRISPYLFYLHSEAVGMLAATSRALPPIIEKHV